MTAPLNRQILLVRRPGIAAAADDFSLVETPLPPLAPGQLRIRNRFLSLDPYMRGRMDDSKSYAAPQPLDQVMQGGTAGEIVESDDPAWPVGTRVVAPGGWQLYTTTTRAGLRRVDDSQVPLSAFLGVVGMPGVTAWYGLNRICLPRSGETLAVSAASGAVGSVVGQLARRLGCRTIGIAGGPGKCRYVTDELGLDACIDYKAGPLAPALANAAPNGIDAYFDNVGGPILDAVLAAMNPHGRVAVCGAISGYDGAAQPLANPRLILVSRLSIRGFIVSEHLEDWPQALAELQDLVATGQLRFRESVAHGLEAAPEAFLGMLKGRNFGKQIVDLGP